MHLWQVWLASWFTNNVYQQTGQKVMICWSLVYLTHPHAIMLTCICFLYKVRIKWRSFLKIINLSMELFLVIYSCPQMFAISWVLLGALSILIILMCIKWLNPAEECRSLCKPQWACGTSNSDSQTLRSAKHFWIRTSHDPSTQPHVPIIALK